MSGFDINQLTITGNLTRDPELRSTSNDISVCSIRIAHNDRRKVNGEWTDVPLYFDVVVWSAMGEWVAGNLAKGAKVVVAGRLNWREYEVDGNKRQAVDITASSVVPVPKNATTAPAAERRRVGSGRRRHSPLAAPRTARPNRVGRLRRANAITRSQHAMSDSTFYDLFPAFPRTDSEWEAGTQRLWTLTPEERVAAMRAGELSYRELAHWSAARPDEVPVIPTGPGGPGEFEWIATFDPDIAEHDETQSRVRIERAKAARIKADQAQGAARRGHRAR